MNSTIAGFHLSSQQKILSLRPFAEPARLSIRTEGTLDSSRLRNAFERLVERHEILRTTYQRSAGMTAPFQIVNEAAAPEVQSELKDGLFTISLPAMSADAASLHNLFRELVDAYAGNELPETLQYADYAQWQADQHGENSEPESNDPAIPPLTLPFQRKESGWGREAVEVACEATEPDILLAAWQILLWRLTGQAEVVVGRVSPGRDHEEFATALGLYESIVPQYANFEEEITFAEAVTRVRNSREDLALGGTELPVGFSVAPAANPAAANGVVFSIADISAIRPFALELRYTAEGTAKLIFDPARFARPDVERFAQRLSIVLAAPKDTLASAVPLMDEAERSQIVNGFNRTKADYPQTLCVQEIFEARVAETPGAPALRFEKTLLTYEELNIRANRIAHALQARGVKADVPVGLLTERSAEMIVGLLGILKAGGCYVPLAADHPRARIEHQLTETKAPVVLTQRGLPEFGDKTVYLDSKLWESGPAHNPPLATTPADLVYVIYTSGSTGTPKGVAVTHGNLVNYSTFLLHRLSAGKWNYATVSTLGADLGNTCVFPALLSGGCLHVIGFETSMNAAAYAAYCRENPIDVLKITPSHLASLLEQGGSAVLPREFLISGGEVLTWNLFERVSGAGRRVLNHYGPTEATVGCCTYLTERVDAASFTVPVGRPIQNAQVYILDRHLQPVPVGTGGEICVGGAGIARGYLNRPEQTAERFVPDPFVANSRLYRTGDLARFLPSGDIEFLGRIDQQVKIRGFRVEPAEVEAAILSLPGIRHVAVIPEEDAAGGKTLAAYAVAAKPMDGAQWRALLSASLPEYMMPARVVWVDAIPLTANGKVDTRALAALGLTTTDDTQPPAGPRNADEERMIVVWREILKTERIGIYDNFFELGGHSLLATQIIARIRKAFGKQVPLHVFLQTPTIADLTSKLGAYEQVESEEATLARLLQELEGISEEEAQMLLAAETGEAVK